MHAGQIRRKGQCAGKRQQAQTSLHGFHHRDRTLVTRTPRTREKVCPGSTGSRDLTMSIQAGGSRSTLPGGPGARGGLAAHARRLPGDLGNCSTSFPRRESSRRRPKPSTCCCCASGCSGCTAAVGGGQHPAQGGGGARPVPIPAARGLVAINVARLLRPPRLPKTSRGDDGGADEHPCSTRVEAQGNWSGHDRRATAPCSNPLRLRRPRQRVVGFEPGGSRRGAGRRPFLAAAFEHVKQPGEMPSAMARRARRPWSR